MPHRSLVLPLWPPTLHHTKPWQQPACCSRCTWRLFVSAGSGGCGSMQPMHARSTHQAEAAKWYQAVSRLDGGKKTHDLFTATPACWANRTDCPVHHWVPLSMHRRGHKVQPSATPRARLMPKHPGHNIQEHSCCATVSERPTLHPHWQITVTVDGWQAHLLYCQAAVQSSREKIV